MNRGSCVLSPALHVTEEDICQEHREELHGGQWIEGFVGLRSKGMHNTTPLHREPF